MQIKWMDWFIYNRDFRHEKVYLFMHNVEERSNIPYVCSSFKIMHERVMIIHLWVFYVLFDSFTCLKLQYFCWFLFFFSSTRNFSKGLPWKESQKIAVCDNWHRKSSFCNLPYVHPCIVSLMTKIKLLTYLLGLAQN